MALDLVNIIDLLDVCVQSITADRSYGEYTIFDTGDYDGATYYFEVVAQNADTSDRFVWLRDSANNDVATITVTASTSVPTRFRSSSFTPTSGEETYHVRLDGTASLDQLKVSQARIIVKQVAATETRLYFPLVNAAYNVYSRATGPTYDICTSGSWEQEAAAGAGYGIYLKDKSSLDALDGSTPWRYETSIKAQNTETVKSTLWNKTTNNQITATELSTTSTSVVHLSVDFSDSATNFDDDDEIEVFNQGGATGVVYCGRATLSVKLASLAKAEVRTRVAFANYSETGAVAYVEQRMLAETDEYDSPTVYFEATGFAATSETILYLRDHSTNDSGSNGSNVSNSGIDLDDSARARDRSSAITLTADNRYYANHAAPSSNDIDLRMALVIIQAESAAAEKVPVSHIIHNANRVPLRVFY